MSTTTIAEAAQLLTSWLVRNPDKAGAQKAALEAYGQLFRPNNIPNITEEDFKGFLLFKNNQHWHGIHRHPTIYSDMPRLKRVLSLLVDESRSIRDRLDQITDRTGQDFISGLSRAVLTPVLMCVYPDKYAVYSRISEEGSTRF